MNEAMFNLLLTAIRNGGLDDNDLPLLADTANQRHADLRVASMSRHPAGQRTGAPRG